MADTPSSILLLRLQSTGSNVNLWGGYINTALQTIERGDKGYEALAVTGDATVSWTNYSAANSGAVARLKLTGSLVSAATLIMPSLQNFLSVDNQAGAQVTIKCSGGTGVAIPNNAKVLIYSDATDYYNAGPTLGPTLTQNTSTYAYAFWGAVETAIATASIPASAGTVLNSGTDTTAGYHLAKHAAASANHTWTTQNAGADEDALLTIQSLALIDGGTISGTGNVSVNSKYLCDFTSTSYTITLPAAPTAGDMILLTKFGENVMTLGLNSLKYKGSTTNPTSSSEGQSLLRYTGATRGWVEL